MLWFHRDKQARMKRRYKARAAGGQLLRRAVGLPSQLNDNIARAERAFQSADADPHEFRELFGEPMPEHLLIASHLETDLWVAIHTTLDGVRNAHLPREEYARLVPRLRHELGTLQQLLDLETEILSSPLSRHFLDRLAALKQVRS